MTALTRIAYEHGGVVDKFVGDLIMVLFGAPVSTGRDAEQAVACALAMLAERRRMNEGAAHPLEVGIGIATGDVVAGCMGSEQRQSYTVLGHRVNLASRLCSVAGLGEIMTDAETARDLPDHLPVTAAEPMRLKGLSEPVEAYRVG
jgi:class 3 adenylate cyclase